MTQTPHKRRRSTRGQPVALPPWRTIRETGGLSLEAVAAKADIDPAHLSRIERGIAQPTLPVAYRLAKALDLAPLVKSLQRYVEDGS